MTVTNCEAAAEFPAPATTVFVNDGNLISTMPAVGAQDSIVAVSSLQPGLRECVLQRPRPARRPAEALREAAVRAVDLRAGEHRRR
ncbi:MAG: hypothetical protein ABS81_25035 [Pseudonocardia sp. SCN 72-86]|nr:MAG: hypothetical protein ABS81_25035 [Pseudonocardia sp. SCN 72-86]